MHNRGFTLIEIAMVTAIIGIMAAFAIIKYQKIVANTELEKTANNLFTELRCARALCFKWDSPVIIKFYAQQCSIYVDTNNNGRDPSDIRKVFSISTPVSIGLTANQPSKWPDSTWIPTGGLADTWQTTLTITPNSTGGYSNGCLYLKNSRLQKVMYCIGITSSMQILKFYKWVGASWFTL